MREREPERDRDLGRDHERQRGAMREIGRFRVVRPEDLERWHYGANRSLAGPDLAKLERRGLIERYPLTDGREVLMLTELGRVDMRIRDGRRYGRAGDARFLAHDAQVYPAYREAVSELKRQGATIRKITFEGAMRGELNRKRPDSRTKLTARERDRIAKEMDLRVIDGAIKVPDMRIEYKDRDGEARKLDLEVATSNYSTRETGQKSGSGMAIRGDNHRGSKLWDNHHAWR